MSNPFIPHSVEEELHRIAILPHPVLLTGETGTGKTWLAREIHRRSGRAGEFTECNCASLNPSLIGSQLFGHRTGAFTGATRDQKGLIEAAHGGTLFLDEIGELPPNLQAKLLRVLDSGHYRPLGESRERKAVFRLITATNREFDALMASMKFRDDLFFRIAALHICMPPLRHRSADFDRLIDEMLRQITEPEPPVELSDDARKALRAHGWPGNLRELRNVLIHALVRSSNGCIRPADLPELRPDGGISGPDAPPPQHARESRYRWRGTPEEERAAILAALEEADGKRTEAAERLGMARSTLWQKMKAYSL